MLKFIFQAVLLLCVVVLIFLGVFDIEREDLRLNKTILLSALIPFALWIGTMCIKYVPANTVGIKWSVFGGTQKDTLSEGIVFKSPLDKVYTIPTTVQERSMKNLSVQTNDSQFLNFSINVKFAVNKDNAYNVYKRYETVDNLKKNVISNYSQKALSLVCTEYNIVDILGEKQNEVYQKASDKLEEMLKDEGVNLIQLTFKDLDAGDEIERAIKNEAVAKKQVETSAQKQEKAKIDAETKKIKAQGEADANAIESEKLTKEILLKQYIEKWDGSLPKVSGNDNNIIDISELLK